MGYPDPTSGVWIYEPGDPDSPMHEVLNQQSNTMHDLFINFDQTVLDAYESAMAQVIADDAVVQQGALDAMQDAAVQAQLAFHRGLLGTTAVPETLQSGVYVVAAASTAGTIGMPVAAPGTLIVSEQSGTGSAQLWLTRAGTPAVAQTWQRLRTSPSAWSAWERIDGRAFAFSQTLSAATGYDIHNWGVAKNGLYAIASTFLVNSVKSAGSAVPPGDYPGVLLHAAASDQIRYQVWYTYPTTTGSLAGSNQWVRWKGFNDTGYGPWKRIATADEIVTSAAGHERDVRVAAMRQRLGRIRTTGKVPVAIVMDHGTNAVQSLIRPMLTSRGLRATLALFSRMYDPTHPRHPNENLTSWAEIQGWHDTDGWEIASHTRSHGDVTVVADMETEIIGARDELEAAMPGVTVDSYVQIGTTGTRWNGFNDGDAWAKYYEHPAGQIILDSHAVVTGLVPNPSGSYPMTGQNLIGLRGLWLDTAASLGVAQATIESEIVAESGRGVILRLHPELIGTGSYTTAAELDAFLGWLAARRDAAEVTVLPLREWAIAED